MAAESTVSSTSPAAQPTVAPTTDPILSSLIFINASQFPLKLEPTTYTAWKAQIDAFLFGYGLLSFVDGTSECPPKTIDVDGKTLPNDAYTLWQRQDKLILHAILSSLEKQVAPMVSTANTSRDAWIRLAKLYANPSSSRILGLKEQLTVLQRGTQPIDEYLRTIRLLADELALINSAPRNDDLVIYTLNGVGPKFREI